MKSIFLAATLLASTAAIAQSAPAPTPPEDQSMPAQPAVPDATTPPAADPQADATMPGNMTAAPTAQASYPRCSATVTDQCRQSSTRESDWKGGPPKHRNRRG